MPVGPPTLLDINEENWTPAEKVSAFAELDSFVGSSETSQSTNSPHLTQRLRRLMCGGGFAPPVSLL
jgi:hypothetical protein